MSHHAAPRRRALARGAAVGALLAASGLFGAPAATAAEDGRPVITLDPPDVGAFLVPAENAEGLWLAAGDAPGDAPGDASGAGGGVAGALAAALPPGAADALPPELAAALGAQGEGSREGSREDSGEMSAESHDGYGGVDVQYGGTITLQLPPTVDATDPRFTLDVLPPDWDDLPRRYRDEPSTHDQPLTVVAAGPGAFTITLPAAEIGFGPDATLTVDRLTMAGTGAELLFPLEYYLTFTGPGVADVPLAPTLGIVADAGCSVDATEPCPGPTVQAGRPVDLAVPADSLLGGLGFGQLDQAVYALESLSDEEDYQSFDSETDPDLVTVHGPAAATLVVPAEARPGPWYGLVIEGDPATGLAVTSFQLDVAAVPVNPGLYSDTGWVEEVRDGVAPGSTAAVAGGALLLVGGLVAVVAVRPGRRPPLGS